MVDSKRFVLQTPIVVSNATNQCVSVVCCQPGSLRRWPPTVTVREMLKVAQLHPSCRIITSRVLSNTVDNREMQVFGNKLLLVLQEASIARPQTLLDRN